MKKKPQKTGYGTVSLPLPLIDKIKDKIEGTGMNSVSSYVSFVLRQVLSSENTEKNMVDKGAMDSLKERLKSLGY